MEYYLAIFFKTGYFIIVVFVQQTILDLMVIFAGI
jgi:hypothetical protein